MGPLQLGQLATHTYTGAVDIAAHTVPVAAQGLTLLPVLGCPVNDVVEHVVACGNQDGARGAGYGLTPPHNHLHHTHTHMPEKEVGLTMKHNRGGGCVKPASLAGQRRQGLGWQWETG